MPRDFLNWTHEYKINTTFQLYGNTRQDINYATNIYDSPEEPTTKIIVANEAVKEIPEYCMK